MLSMKKLFLLITVGVSVISLLIVLSIFGYVRGVFAFALDVTKSADFSTFLPEPFEKTIRLDDIVNDDEITIYLLTSGAVFYLDGKEIGALHYRDVFYYVTDSENKLTSKVIAHDTSIKIYNRRDEKIMEIVNRRDSIDFLASGGTTLYSAEGFNSEDKSGGLLLFYSNTGDVSKTGGIIASVERLDDSLFLCDSNAKKIYSTTSNISPSGLLALLLPDLTLNERLALMLMIK